jgi:hypothetical protein
VQSCLQKVSFNHTNPALHTTTDTQLHLPSGACTKGLLDPQQAAAALIATTVVIIIITVTGIGTRNKATTVIAVITVITVATN